MWREMTLKFGVKFFSTFIVRTSSYGTTRPQGEQAIVLPADQCAVSAVWRHRLPSVAPRPSSESRCVRQGWGRLDRRTRRVLPSDVLNGESARDLDNTPQCRKAAWSSGLLRPVAHSRGHPNNQRSLGPIGLRHFTELTVAGSARISFSRLHAGGGC